MSSKVCSDVDMARPSTSCAEPTDGIILGIAPSSAPAGVTWAARRISTAASSKQSPPAFLPVHHVHHQGHISLRNPQVLVHRVVGFPDLRPALPAGPFTFPYTPLLVLISPADDSSPRVLLLRICIHLYYIAASYLPYLKLILSFSSPLHFLSF